MYYRSIRSKGKAQNTAKDVVDLVLTVRKKMPRLGTRKLYYLLNEPLKRLHVGRDKLFTILNANHLCIKPERRYRTTTNSHHRFRKHKDLLASMDIVRPEQIWVSDITYVGNRNSHNFLALVTDAYSKKIMGYDLSNSLSTDGAIRALRMALKKRKYKTEILTHHSDRGIQYCSNEYQKLLTKNKIQPSMTESYDPYANAIAERVNGILKGEFELEKYVDNRYIIGELVKDSVHTYNKLRPHYSCYMLTPNQMHNQRKIKMRTYKKKQLTKLTL